MNGLPKKPTATSTGSPQPHRPETLAKSHLAHSSIRGQTARQKKKAKEQESAENSAGGGSGTSTPKNGKSGPQVETNRPFVKAVLANPLTPRWSVHPIKHLGGRPAYHITSLIVVLPQARIPKRRGTDHPTSSLRFIPRRRRLSLTKRSTQLKGEEVEETIIQCDETWRSSES